MPAPSDEEYYQCEELLKLMGHVLSSWQGVEHAVFDLYRSFFAEDHGDVAAVTFFAIRTFDARTTVVDALIREFASSHVKLWENVKKRIRKLAKSRNAVAHWSFGLVGTPPKRKALLGPSIYDVSRFPIVPRDHEFYSANELKNSAFAYVELTKQVYEFRAKLLQDKTFGATLRKRPQRLDENDQKYPLTFHVPTEPSPSPQR